SVVTAARKKVRVVDFPPGRKGKVRAEHTAQEPGSSAGSPKAPGRGQPTSRKDTPAREHERATSAAGRAASSRKTPTATPPAIAGRKETPERGTGTGAARSKPATEPAAAAGKRTEPARGRTAATTKPSAGARDSSADRRAETSTRDRAASTP